MGFFDGVTHVLNTAARNIHYNLTNPTRAVKIAAFTLALWATAEGLKITYEGMPDIDSEDENSQFCHETYRHKVFNILQDASIEGSHNFLLCCMQRAATSAEAFAEGMCTIYNCLDGIDLDAYTRAVFASKGPCGEAFNKWFFDKDAGFSGGTAYGGGGAGMSF